MIKPDCVDTRVTRKLNLDNDYFALTLGGYHRTGDSHPGQFVQVKLPGSEILFRRPMSIAAVHPDSGELDIIFKVFGRGTRLMGDLHHGDIVNILGPLGKPFTRPKDNETVVMVAGGVGFPPLYFLAESLIREGYDPKQIEFFYGGRSAADILYQDRIRQLDVNFRPITEDGSLGPRGLVTEPLIAFIRENRQSNLKLYSCGPEPMLKVVNEIGMEYKIRGELSMEAPMPCGIGVCLGCVVPRCDGGHSRVCIDGPVFEIGEIKL